MGRYKKLKIIGQAIILATDILGECACLVILKICLVLMFISLLSCQWGVSAIYAAGALAIFFLVASVVFEVAKKAERLGKLLAAKN